ncbi:MAG: tetratricopeptide repeat protein [Blastocatellia bacterium]|nr:tetratricopeptide repeat protein [Blastocatellia bacterium]
MKSILYEIQYGLREFIVNRDLNLLIVPCEIEHSAFLLKSIDAIEQNPAEPDIFLTFGYPFDVQTDYIEEILAEVGRQMDHLREELAKRDNHFLLEAFTELEDRSLPPAIRLARVMEQIRKIVPAQRQVIWIFYPEEILDSGHYLQLIGYLQNYLAKPSMRGTKLIVREDSASPILAERLDQRGTRIYRTRLDPDSFEKMLAAKATDRAIPAEERAQMHMMLAGYDVAHRRYDLALTRNLELLNFFAYKNQPYNRAIVLNNIGDLFYIQEKWPEAQAWYRRAVALSVDLGSKPLVFNQSINLGNALLMQNNYSESLIYYRAAERYAESSGPGMIIQQIQVLERIGLACHRKGEYEEAAEALEKAATLNEKIKNFEGQRSNLDQLSGIYSALGDGRRLRQNQAKLSAVNAAERAAEEERDSEAGEEGEESYGH